MAIGNGADTGRMFAMLREILESHGALRDGQMVLRGDISALREEHGRRLGDLARDILALRGDVSTLRQDVTMYHGSVIGHGMLITEIDERSRRVEAHLNLPSAA